MGVASNGFSVVVKLDRRTEQDDILKIVKARDLDYDIYANELTVSPIFCEHEANELDLELSSKLAELRESE